MKYVNTHEAKTQLSKLIAAARAGEEIVICQAGKPVARLAAYESVRKKPRLGAGKDKVILRPGLNSITFKQGLTKQQESYTYEAVFDPIRVLNEKGERIREGLAGDRVQNNRATTHVIALGQRRILFIEPARLSGRVEKNADVMNTFAVGMKFETANKARRGERSRNHEIAINIFALGLEVVRLRHLNTQLRLAKIPAARPFGRGWQV